MDVLRSQMSERVFETFGVKPVRTGVDIAGSRQGAGRGRRGDSLSPLSRVLTSDPQILCRSARTLRRALLHGKPVPRQAVQATSYAQATTYKLQDERDCATRIVWFFPTLAQAEA